MQYQSIGEANEILIKMQRDIIDTFWQTQEKGIGIMGCLPYEVYIQHGHYKEYLSDYIENDGVINYFSLARISGVPLPCDMYSEDICYISNRLGKTDFSPEEYDSIGNYTSKEIIELFGSWEDAIARSLKIDRGEIPYRNSQLKRPRMPARLRYKVFVRDGFRCVLCGATASDEGTKLHVDHIIPVFKGGTNSIDNLRTLCAECNLGKGTLMIEK